MLNLAEAIWIDDIQVSTSGELPLINTKQSRLLDSIRFFEMNQDFLLIVNQLVIIDEHYQLPNGYR